MWKTCDRAQVNKLRKGIGKAQPDGWTTVGPSGSWKVDQTPSPPKYNSSQHQQQHTHKPAGKRRWNKGQQYRSSRYNQPDEYQANTHQELSPSELIDKMAKAFPDKLDILNEFSAASAVPMEDDGPLEDLKSGVPLFTSLEAKLKNAINQKNAIQTRLDEAWKTIDDIKVEKDDIERSITHLEFQLKEASNDYARQHDSRWGPPPTPPRQATALDTVSLQELATIARNCSPEYDGVTKNVYDKVVGICRRHGMDMSEPHQSHDITSHPGGEDDDGEDDQPPHKAQRKGDPDDWNPQQRWCELTEFNQRQPPPPPPPPPPLAPVDHPLGGGHGKAPRHSGSWKHVCGPYGG